MTDRKRTARRPAEFDLRGYVERLPGYWEPEGMADAEAWKRAQARGSKPPPEPRRRTGARTQ